MSKLYAVEDTFASIGWLTNWMCPPPVGGAYQVVRDQWVLDEQTRPVRQIFSFKDAVSGELVGGSGE